MALDAGSVVGNEVYAFQWDLSSETAEITSFHIDWSGTAHGQIVQMQLNQSNQYAQVVPEPSSAMLLGIAALGVFRRRR